MASLPLGQDHIDIHVVVNGSTDRTAEYARDFSGAGVIVHEYREGGKSRSWNRFVLAEAPDAECYVFVDGDARLLPGSVTALAQCLLDHPAASAAAGLPCNGRNVQVYREGLTRTHGLFGDLYALRGSFVSKMRKAGISLPADLIGDDSLIGALAKTDLENEDQWQDRRIVVCDDAGFLCDSPTLTPAGLQLQYRRMVNYSVRHFQNRIVSSIMRNGGPAQLPERVSLLYPDWLPRFAPRRHPLWWWFDRVALARMRALP